MFTYSRLTEELCYFLHAGAEVGSIGYSESGRLIPYIRVGSRTGCKIIVTGAIHARENVTAALVMRQAAYALEAGALCGSAYFIPMLNPDGALLIEHGADFFGERKDFLKEINGGSDDFSLWKANIDAVDLNVNFDARFGCGSRNVRFPTPENYIGSYPFSARETECIKNFTLDVMPDCTISYHAKGQELYWYFHQTGWRKNRDLRLACYLNERLGYRLGADETDSAGGYKDWCVDALRIPAFTVEVVSDSLAHPLPDDALSEDEWERNKDLPIRLMDYLASKENNR